LLHRFEVATLVRAPDLDRYRRAGFGDAACFAQGGDHVVGEEEGVEAGDEVERVVLPGQILHLADAKIRVRQSDLCEGDERVGGVDAVRFAAALDDEAQERPDAATDVEHAPPGLEAGPLECCLVGGELTVFAERPIVGTGAPERSPPARAAGRGG
jgi:hypothetical protein